MPRIVIAISALLITSNVLAEYGRKSIRVFVALCDNKNQGIVPVLAKLGNGNDPANNLYWGAMYGVKGYLKRNRNWILLYPHKKNLSRNILQELKALGG